MSRDRQNWMPFSGSVSKDKILRSFFPELRFLSEHRVAYGNKNNIVVIRTDYATRLLHRQQAEFVLSENCVVSAAFVFQEWAYSITGSVEKKSSGAGLYKFKG